MSNKNDFEIVLTKYNGNEAHVVIPDCVTRIDGYAFAGNTKLTTLIISNQVKDIEPTTFWDCYNLERIKIGKGLEKVSDEGLIGDCANFKGFEVDEENKYFKAIDGNLYTKDGDFLYYAIGKKEESFTVPIGVRKIGPFAFACCQYLQSVIVPQSVEEISDKCIISGCDNFKGFKVDKENKYFKAVDGDLYTKDGELLYYAIGKKEETFTVPIGVRKIGPSAFIGCQYLRSVIISEGVEEIGKTAFWGASLKDIVLPSSLQKIGETSFNDGNEDMIIKAPKGSYAIKWAKKNKMKYEEI